MDALTIVSMIFGMCGVGGIISSLVIRQINKMEKRMEERADARVRENTLLMEGIAANGELSEATAISLKNQHFNSEVDNALVNYREVRGKIDDHLRQQCAEKNWR